MIATRTFLPRVSVLTAVLATASACTRAEPESAGVAVAGTAESKIEGPDAPKAAALAAAPSATVLPPRATPPELIPHARILGHVLLKNPLALIKKVNEQVAPPMFGMLVNEYVLRTQLASALGERTAVSEHLRLDGAIGCAVSEGRMTDVPITCVFGYTGGAAALVTDLGEAGKQADPAGHLAHYIFGEENVFIDTLGDAVVITNHADVLAESREYVEQALLPRGTSLAVDLEAVGYLGNAFLRHREALLEIFAPGFPTALSPESDAEPSATAFAAWLAASRQSQARWLEGCEQLRVGVGIDPAGLAVELDLHGAAGSENGAMIDRITRAGATDLSLVRALPNTTWWLSVARVVPEVMNAPSLAALKTFAIHMYATALEKDPEAVTKDVDAFLAETDALYRNDTALGFLHVPGTTGGAVLVSALEPGGSGREAWKAWSASFSPAAVLGPTGARNVNWTFTADAAEYGGAVIDRWVVEPTAEGKRALLRDGDETAKSWDLRTNGFKLVIDRFEWDGLAVFVAVPGDATAYTQAAINAAQGRGSLQGEPAFQQIANAANDAYSVMAFDVQGGADWLRAVAPVDVATSVPKGLGVDLTDVTVLYDAESRVASGTLRLSQPLLSTLRTTLGTP